MDQQRRQFVLPSEHDQEVEHRENGNAQSGSLRAVIERARQQQGRAHDPRPTNIPPENRGPINPAQVHVNPDAVAEAERRRKQAEEDRRRNEQRQAEQRQAEQRQAGPQREAEERAARQRQAEQRQAEQRREVEEMRRAQGPPGPPHVQSQRESPFDQGRRVTPPRNGRFKMPQVAIGPDADEDEIIYIEDASGHASRAELISTFHYLKFLGGLAGLANSAGTTVAVVLSAQFMLFNTSNLWGLAIGLAIATALTAIQVWCSDWTSHGKAVAYLLSLAGDMAFTFTWWIGWLFTLGLIIGARQPQAIFWIAVAECAVIEGWLMYQAIQTRFGRVSDRLFYSIMVFSLGLAYGTVTLFFASRTISDRVYWTAFGIAVVIAFVSAWLPEHAVFGNRLRKRVVRREPEEPWKRRGI